MATKMNPYGGDEFVFDGKKPVMNESSEQDFVTEQQWRAYTRALLCAERA